MSTVAATEDLRYPIGKFSYASALTSAERASAERAEKIQQIAEAPAKLRAAVAGLSDAQLDTPYRPGGWTVRQLVHHVPDSHLNAYIRFKWTLTENDPKIKAYDEKLWAETKEINETPPGVSLALLESLHVRWVVLLKAMQPEEFDRTLQHPENGTMTLDRMLALYAWHGRHHVAHIDKLKERMGW